MISVKVLSCVPIQTKQTNISIFLPKFGLLSLLCRPTLISYVPRSRLIKKTQWQTWPLFWLSKNLTSAKESGASTFTLRERLHETQSELKTVWNLKSLWKVIPFTWQFQCGNVQIIAIERIGRNREKSMLLKNDSLINDSF